MNYHESKKHGGHNEFKTPALKKYRHIKAKFRQISEHHGAIARLISLHLVVSLHLALAVPGLNNIKLKSRKVGFQAKSISTELWNIWGKKTLTGLHRGKKEL